MIQSVVKKAVEVQFRFLQVVTNHVADERVTVALLHWDGREFRFATNVSRVPDHVPSKADLGPLLRSLGHSIAARSKELSLAFNLDDLAPTPVGETGLLSWGILRLGQTQHPQRHFEQLAQGLGLMRVDRPFVRAEADDLLDWAQRLAIEVARPDVLLARHPLHGLVEYESPLSWKNGVWHHTFPVVVHEDDAKSYARRLQQVFGRIDATVPREQIGVVVTMHDTSERAMESAARGQEYIRRNLEGRVDVLAAPVRKGIPDFEVVDRRVRNDVGPLLTL